MQAFQYGYEAMPAPPSKLFVGGLPLKANKYMLGRDMGVFGKVMVRYIVFQRNEKFPSAFFIKGHYVEMLLALGIYFN